MSLEEGINEQGNPNYGKIIKAVRQEATLYGMDLVASSKYQAQPNEQLQAIEKSQEPPKEETLAPPLPPAVEPINVHEHAPAEKQQERHTDVINTEDARRRKIAIFSATAIILIIAIMGIIITTPGALTGYITATREVQQTVDYNQAFSQSTETQLTLNNIVGLRISGRLEGTAAKVKLRINGTDYLIADIVNPGTWNQTILEQTPEYSIRTDKKAYLIGETATITITPDTENKSLYVSYGEQTQKLDNNAYAPQELGEYQAIALITLPDNILRLEINFTVINGTILPETPEPTPETPPEQNNAYEFSELCTDTCTLAENSNPILIIETAENSTLVITQIITTQTKENQAPIQTQNIPDINLITGQVATLGLNQYFTDPEGDLVQYDINQILEINATISQNILAITSATPGIYTAYIYATDGDKLVTSNTFQITITQSEENQPINETPIITGETNLSNETNQAIPVASFTDCSDPNPNLRPPECIQGNEEQYFKNTPIYLQNLDRAIVGRVTAFGNIMIRGKLIENSEIKPGSRDFKISYFINDGETEVAAAWIDSQTGDLHLTGKIFEEQFSIMPTSQDAFLIQNRKGTNLGFIDRQTGNLYLRGNLIQERKEEDITE